MFNSGQENNEQVLSFSYLSITTVTPISELLQGVLASTWGCNDDGEHRGHGGGVEGAMCRSCLPPSAMMARAWRGREGKQWWRQWRGR